MTWWQPSWRADPRGAAIADRHYNRQSVGADQFVPPGRCMVLRHDDDALWITSWPFAEFVQSKVRPKRTPGYCYLMAGFRHVGFTKAGLWTYQMLPDEMPDAVPAHPRQLALEGV